MDFAQGRFNTYLLALLVTAFTCGCQTNQKKVEQTDLRVHTEARDNSSFTRKVSVLRATPVDVVVDQSPILTQEQIVEAKVVEALGGFAIQLKFDSRGQWLLDHHSSLNIGRRFAIFVAYGDKKAQTRWLAAPIISGRITDGMLIFTPDATREEAEAMLPGIKPEKSVFDEKKADKPKAEPEK